MATLQERVDAAMAIAQENGYHQRADLTNDYQTANDLAVDLMDCDADFEDEDFNEVLACMQVWLAGQFA